MRALPNAPCPCHSGQRYKQCCQPWHQGRPAPTPEALMRARYAAAAIGKASFWMETTDPDGSRYEHDAAAWRASVLAFSRGTRFVGLEVIDAGVHEDGQTGWVRFFARLTQGGADASFGELSRFRKQDGRWLYVDGEVSMARG